jgi:hypothetical protein
LAAVSSHFARARGQYQQAGAVLGQYQQVLASSEAGGPFCSEQWPDLAVTGCSRQWSDHAPGRPVLAATARGITNPALAPCTHCLSDLNA